MLELAQAQYHLPKDTVSKILGTSDFADPDSPQIDDEAALPAHCRPEHSARLLASRGEWEQQAGCCERADGPGGRYGGWPGC